MNSKIKFRFDRSVAKEISAKELNEYLDKYEELKRYHDRLVSGDNACKYVLRYCWITNKTPYELLHLAETRGERIEQAQLLMEDLLTEIKELEPNPTARLPLPSSTIWLMFNCTKGFYKKNALDLPREAGNYLYSLKKEKELPTKEMIKNLRDLTTNFRDRVIVHFLSVIPLRKATLLKVTWEDFNLNEEYPMTIIKGDRLKGKGASKKYQGVIQIAIVSKTLKKDLKKLKELDKKQFKKASLEWSERTPIFINRNCEAMNYKSVSTIWERYFKKLEKKYGVHYSLKSFRNWFESQITVAKAHGVSIPEDVRYWLLAHKITGITHAYDLAYQKKTLIIDIFKKLEPFVDIDYTLDMRMKGMAKALRGVQATQPNLSLEEQLKLACKESGMQLITFLTEVLIKYEKIEEEKQNRKG